MRKLSIGTSISQGIAIGNVFVVQKKELTVSTKQITAEQKSAEINHYKKALAKAIEQLKVLSERSDIFAAHAELAQDSVFTQSVCEKIETELKNAEQSLAESTCEICAMFEALQDKYLRERAEDIKDISRRIMEHLKDMHTDVFMDISSPVIVVAEDLTPSDTINMNLDFVQGFITAKGGTTSHVSILARQKELPAFIGASDILELVKHNDEIILDAIENNIFIHPNEKTKALYAEKAIKYKAEKEIYNKSINLPSVTKDGHEMKLCANVGTLIDLANAKAAVPDGVGLFRSEFLYMQNSNFPTENEQFNIYKTAVLQTENSIVIRTLDIGGDKNLPYYNLPQEENPFLGLRSIRFSLTLEDIFKAQLRAILRASAFGDIRIMYPMIISLDELREANALLENCKKELKKAGIAYNNTIKVGMMIETPASVLLAEQFAKEVDFFSIGTNDLTQYLLAVDRGNSNVASLYSSFHPAVIRSIRYVTAIAHKASKHVAVCGELAGDERALPLLLGLGIDELSMCSGNIPKMRYLLRNLDFTKAELLAKEICAKSTTSEVLALL